jgi:hypothetical protein
VVFPLVIGVLLVAGFAGLILPLFRTSGVLHAEITGETPAAARLGEQTPLDLAIDNTGDALIRPICLLAHFDRPVEVVSVVFQGLDRVGFRDGRACGGQLSGGEPINVRVLLVPRATGVVAMTLVAGQGAQPIGPVVHRSMTVSR